MPSETKNPALQHWAAQPSDSHGSPTPRKYGHSPRKAWVQPSVVAASHGSSFTAHTAGAQAPSQFAPPLRTTSCSALSVTQRPPQHPPPRTALTACAQSPIHGALGVWVIAHIIATATTVSAPRLPHPNQLAAHSIRCGWPPPLRPHLKSGGTGRGWPALGSV